MKDIDFDELDRAVSSLMSGVPKAEPVKDEGVKTLALNPDIPVGESEPERADISPVAVPAGVDEAPRTEEQPKLVAMAPTTSALPAARRRGRFMDVVRSTPPEVKKPAPSQAVSRQAATIAPSANFVRPSAPSIEGITPRPSSPQPAPSGQAPKQPDKSASEDWPDPLDAAEFNETTETVTVSATQTAPLSLQTTSQDTNTQPPEGQAPLASPFLPDAKVEKRPLGRLADADTPFQSAPEPDHAPVLGALSTSDSAVAEGAGASQGDIATPEQPLPAELSHEVMAIEADTGSLPVETHEPTDETETVPVRPVSAAPAPATIRPVATSIPQQYKVQPKKAEPSSGAIYDTATYHQPLAHPAKKKPGWLWVIAIILILLLGAAGGAAVYFLGLV